MFAGSLQRFTSFALWTTVSIFFSIFVSSGAIMFAAVILVALFGVIAVMLGPQFIAASWLVGSPTVFGFPNELLRALPFVTTERLLFGLLVVLVFLQYSFSKRKTKWLPVEITILVFLVYAMASLALHTDSETLRKDGWMWIQYLLPMAGFIVSRRIEWDDRRLRILLAALTFTGVFVAVIGVLQSRFNIDVFTMNYQTITAGHSGRAYGTFSNAHTFVASLFIFLTITLLQFSIYKDSLIRFVLIMAMGVIALSIVLGASRAPWIGAALAFVILFIKHPQIRPLIIVGGTIGVFVGMIFFVIMIDQLYFIIVRIMNFGTLEGRAAVWATALNMIAHNPVFGLGFGEAVFQNNKPEYITGIGSLTAQYAVYLGIPHNEYLHVAVLLGVTGLVLFLMVLVRMVKLMFQIYNHDQQTDLRRYLALYLAAIMIGLMFNSLFSDTFIQDYFWFLTYFLAGIAAGNLQAMPLPDSKTNR